MSDFSLSATLGLDNSGFNRGLRQSRRAVSGARSSIRSLIGPVASLAAGYLSLRTAVRQGTAALTQAAGAERTRATFEVLLGSAREAKSLFEDLTKFSNATPFEPGPIQEAGKALLANNFEAAQLRDLLKDAGDLASVMGRDIGEVARVFGRLNSGDFGESFERLRDFGISRQDLEGQGLEFDGGGQFQGSVEDAMAAVRRIIQRDFGGTMEKIAKTNSGLMSTLRGQWQEVQRIFGEPINTALKPVLKDGIELVKDMKDEAKDLGENVASAVSSVFNAFKQNRGLEFLTAGLNVAARSFANQMLNGMKRAAEAFGAALAAVSDTNLIPGLRAGMRSVALEFVKTIATTLEALLPEKYGAAVREATEIGMRGVVNDTLREGGFSRNPTFTGREITAAGREEAARRGVDVDGLSDRRAFIELRNAMIKTFTDQVDKAPSERLGDQAKTAAGESADLLTKSVPKVAEAFGRFAAEQGGNDTDFFGAAGAKAAFAELRESIDKTVGGSAAIPRDLRNRFGTGIPGGLIDRFGTGDFGEFLSRARESLGRAASGGGDAGSGGGGPAGNFRAENADRLLRIGGIVGGLAPARRAADRTARATEQTAREVRRLRQQRQRDEVGAGTVLTPAWV